MGKSIQEKFDSITTEFKTGKTKPYEYRLEKLKLLKSTIIEYEDKIIKALHDDLNKARMESYMSEYKLVLDEIDYMLKHLKKLMKDRKIRPILAQMPSKIRLRYEPYGKVLIISPWNYPFFLSLNPVIGAVAAGNTFILKPSNYSIHTSDVLEEIISKVFSKDYVVLGSRVENKALLDLKFDYIFFTGSVKVGKVVMKKASENLIPITLELGGKSPCFVDKTCDLEKSAERILFGKLMNAGQTCVAVDYILADESIIDDLIVKLKEKYKEMIPNEDYRRKYMPRIIDEKHLQRINSYFDKDMGLYMDLYIEKTTLDSKFMKDELFAPILPVIPFERKEDLKEIFDEYNKPLSMYIFSKDDEFIEYLLDNVQSGGVSINDTLFHMMSPRAPFGGVGNSGMGNYHGEFSFKTFSHERTVLKKWCSFDIKSKYHPYSEKKFDFIKKLM